VNKVVNQKQFDLSAKISKAVVGNSLALDDSTVVFLGDDPFTADDLASLLPDGCRTIADTVDSTADFIVVGTDGFDEAQLIDLARSARSDCAFLPHDGFLDLILFGYNWWTDHHQLLEEVALYHPAFKILKALDGFAWPSTYAPETTGGGTTTGEFRSQTELMALGYQITGMTRPGRWRAIERAVPALRLQLVAETIANNMRSRKSQRDGRHKYRNSIREWTHDLNRLKSKYYVGSASRFRWPSLDP